MEPTGVESLLQKAEEYLKRNQYLKALSIYQKILQEPQASPLALEWAFNRAGECYLGLQIYNEAEDYLRQAAGFNPFNPEPHYYLGIVYTKTSRWIEAVFELKLALQLRPREPVILRSLGWALFLTGKSRAGERVLKRCLKLNEKDLYAYCDLAALYLNTAAFAKAEEVIEQAEKIAPRHPLLLNVKTACQHFKRLKGDLEKQTKPGAWRTRLAGEKMPASSFRAPAAKTKMPEAGPLEAPRTL